MANIKIHFNNGRTAKYPAEKTAFRAGDGEKFRLSFSGEETIGIEELMNTGGVLVNWDSVAFVRMEQRAEDEE